MKRKFKLTFKEWSVAPFYCCCCWFPVNVSFIFHYSNHFLSTFLIFHSHELINCVTLMVAQAKHLWPNNTRTRGWNPGQTTHSRQCPFNPPLFPSTLVLPHFHLTVNNKYSIVSKDIWVLIDIARTHSSSYPCSTFHIDVVGHFLFNAKISKWLLQNY